MGGSRASSKGDWRSLGGSKRERVNVNTGQIISRRQYDQRFGILAAKGQGTYERKAKESKQRNPTLAAARPARGRSSSLEVTKFEQMGKNLRVSKHANKKGVREYAKFKDIELPIHTLDGGPDYARLVKDYDALAEGLKSNSRVFGMTVNLGYDFKQGKDKWKSAAINLLPTRHRSSFASGWEVAEQIEHWLEVFGNSMEIKPKFLDLHIIFASAHFDKFIPPKTRKGRS